MPTTATAFEVTTTGRRKIGAADRLIIKIDDEEFVFVRPKVAVLTQIAGALNPDEAVASFSNTRALLQFVGQLLLCIEEEPAEGTKLHGRARLNERLTDPYDALDITDLLPQFEAMVEGFLGRPTGPRRASSAPRAGARAGGSRARTPHKRA
jgi:hypothetical protein